MMMPSSNPTLPRVGARCPSTVACPSPGAESEPLRACHDRYERSRIETSRPLPGVASQARRVVRMGGRATGAVFEHSRIRVTASHTIAVQKQPGKKNDSGMASLIYTGMLKLTSSSISVHVEQPGVLPLRLKPPEAPPPFLRPQLSHARHPKPLPYVLRALRPQRTRLRPVVVRPPQSPSQPLQKNQNTTSVELPIRK